MRGCLVLCISRPSSVITNFLSITDIFGPIAKMKPSFSFLALASATAALNYQPSHARSKAARANSIPIPTSNGSVTLKEAQEVTGVFDGGMKVGDHLSM
jgi:hypothetical protein